MNADIREKAAAVHLMIFDVDGILTDGKLFFGPEGEELKVFHVLDGHGIRMLHEAGIRTAIISARKSAMVARRAEDLGIGHVYLGIQDKLSAFETLLRETGTTAENCGYMGDDVIDLPVLARTRFSASVPSAHEEVRRRVDHITAAPAGGGAVREVCDLLLKAQDKYRALLESYLK